ncbi:MAG: 50S ribosomal protein L34e [Candidatus Micrarchaeia archaeon]
MVKQVLKLPRPMYRSRNMRRLARVTPSKKNVVHYKKKQSQLPHCGICGKELHGISIKKGSKGKTLRSNSRMFGGVLCANCTADIVKLASRIEHGELRLNDIGIKQKEFVLQLISH